ncbi:MAG: flagellar hook-length control protein FliK [Thalassobaculaceae bacterium]|nr:flagellar hook-length control protein FliK [Thalassobaculaceae bacterium]
MELQSIDPRATSPAANGRNAQSSSGGAFQGVMQMMAEIADNRTETKAHQRPESDRPTRAEKSRDRNDRPRDVDERAPATAEADKDETEVKGDAAIAVQQPLTDVPPLPVATAEAPSANDGSAEAAIDQAAALQQAPAGVDAQKQSVPRDAAAKPTTPAQPVGASQAATPAQTPAQTQAQASTLAAASTQSAPKPASEEIAALARQAMAQSDQTDASAKNSGTGQKTDGAAGRADPLMGAKVTTEVPVPVARSQGVSSAILVQAQQAAAGGQPQVSTANGGAGTLHVGGNQPTFVGADGNAGQAANGQNGGGQNGGSQNAGGQNPNAQNQGQGGQSNPQQIGVSFGATIGQRGFGGDASRAQFQEILATKTARAQPGSAGGEGMRPMGATGGSTSSTPMTMAGVGGPQSTDTSASPANRAAATAHGRPGAALGTPADQVAVKLSSTAKEGGGKVTIRLSPEELGKVDIKMEISKDGLVRAVVSADRPETLELLQKDAKGLERALQNAGLQTDGESLEFDLRGGGGQHAGDTEGEAGTKGMPHHSGPEIADDGDLAANDQQGDDGSGGMKADGSLDLVA